MWFLSFSLKESMGIWLFDYCKWLIQSLSKQSRYSWSLAMKETHSKEAEKGLWTLPETNNWLKNTCHKIIKLSVRKTVEYIMIARESVWFITSEFILSEIELVWPYKLKQVQLLTDENKGVWLEIFRKLLKWDAARHWEQILFVVKSYSQWNNYAVIRMIGFSQQFLQASLTWFNQCWPWECSLCENSQV